MIPHLILGCTAPSAEDGDEHTSVAAEAVTNDNALSANALSANSLFANALSANALSANALSANALSAGALAAIQDPGDAGDLSRQLLKYTVSCALDSTQSFAFSWTDAQDVTHDEVYPGQLGIAPGWAKHQLNGEGQRLVSSCLAARVNYYEVPVLISARSKNGPLKDRTRPAEILSYPDVEGAFWGNLFTDTPWLNACYDSANVDNSRAHLRECAAGHLNDDGTVSQCGMIRIVGECGSRCQKMDDKGDFYPQCVDRPGVSNTNTDHVITVGLP